MAELNHVVILGAGFGGIGALKKLRDADVRITIVDKRNYHTFQPLLYQVATDELGPTEVGFPIRELLHGHNNITFHQAAAKTVDLVKKLVVTDGADPIQYDYLVLALGAMVNFFHTPGADQYALPLYTMEDAIRLKEHILKTFEAVDKSPGLMDDGALTFCVVGGGPTGVELAGALVETMQEKSVAAFANKNRADSNVVVKTYERFNEIIKSIKNSAESKNPESAIAVLNLTYSIDKIARCWVDVADLVKPVHLTAPLKNA